MRRADEPDGQVHGLNLRNLLCHHSAEGIEDIGVVFLCLIHHVSLVHAVVVERLRCEVLAEGVIREHDAAVAVIVSEHRVGPVHHRHLYEGQRVLSQGERVACLHVDEVPVLVVVSAYDGLALLCAVDGRAGNLTHEFWQCAAMVDFIVVHHDEIDVFQVYLLLQAADELLVVGLPYGVDERHFLVAYKVGIITGAAMCRQLVAVEMRQFPVDLADPADFLC